MNFLLLPRCVVLRCTQVRRLHFHDFMLDVHKRLRNMSGEADPLKHVADDVAAGVKVRAGMTHVAALHALS